LDRPFDSLTAMMVLRNIDHALHSTYREHKTGKAIWLGIKNSYTGDTSSFKSQLLTTIAVFVSQGP
jgi:hypothetical protein